MFQQTQSILIWPYKYRSLIWTNMMPYALQRFTDDMVPKVTQNQWPWHRVPCLRYIYYHISDWHFYLRWKCIMVQCKSKVDITPDYDDKFNGHKMLFINIICILLFYIFCLDLLLYLWIVCFFCMKTKSLIRIICFIAWFYLMMFSDLLMIDLILMTLVKD